MDILSQINKRQAIAILLPFLIMWTGGLWVLGQSGASPATGPAVMACYFLLSLILAELSLLEPQISRAGFHGCLRWSAALTFLWALHAGLTGSRPLAALFACPIPVNQVFAGRLTAALSLLLMLPLFLTIKKDLPHCSRKVMVSAAALSASACIWEPARYTLSLCFLAAVLLCISQELADTRKKEAAALSEAETLSELNRMKNQSYADLSHEMKTPLTVISVNAQMVEKTLEGYALDEETLTDIRIISSEASRLTQMVTSLVGLGRLQGSGNECALFSPDTLVKTTARTCQALAARYGNALTVTSGPDLPSVLGNADRLTQVLINLINNANRHTRNGSIHISVESDGDQVKVSVTDNGEGIDPELLPHVFERFCRGDKGNIGLGLSICKKIIDEHGGHMGIESKAGSGTRVWFTLPARCR